MGFVSDDYLYHSAFNFSISDFLAKAALMHGGELSIPEFFRPLGIISLRLDFIIWGDDPIGFHLTNLLLHSLNALLLFFLLRRFGLKQTGSAVAAMLFALYPLNSEPVAWVSGRFDLLAATFTLLTLHMWSISRLRNDLRWMIPALIFFFMGILSKENAAAGILLLPIIDTILNLKTRKEWGTGTGWLWQWYVIFAAIVVVIIGFRLWYFGDIGGYSDQTNQATYFYVPVSALMHNLFAADLKMLFSPVSRILWPVWNVVFRFGLAAIGIFFWAGLAISLYKSIGKALKTDETDLAIIIGGIFWIIIMILPVLPIGGVQDSLNCSRFLYIPLAGFALWIGVAVDSGLRAGPILKNVTVALVIMILAVSGLTLHRNNVTWLEAGQIASRINTVMETYTVNLPENTTIFTVNHPLLWKGASCSPLKYDWYVEYLYGTKNPTTMEMRMNPGEILDWWENLSGNYSKPGIGFVWDETSLEISVLPLFVPSENAESNRFEETPALIELDSAVSTVGGEELETESTSISTIDEIDIFASPE
ncbi:MAG: hypothetical protein NTY09_09410 [bacterium]|nr:hypothetical protein [bacterium]